MEQKLSNSDIHKAAVRKLLSKSRVGSSVKDNPTLKQLDYLRVLGYREVPRTKDDASRIIRILVDAKTNTAKISGTSEDGFEFQVFDVGNSDYGDCL